MELVLKGKGIQKGWMFLKKENLKVQNQAVPPCHKMIQWGRRSAWLNRELLMRFQEKQFTISGRRFRQLTKTTKMLPGYAEGKIRKVKTYKELNLATTYNKKYFYKHVNIKRWAKENLMAYTG